MRVGLQRDDMFDSLGSTIRRLKKQKSLQRKYQLTDVSRSHNRKSMYEANNDLQQEMDKLKTELNYSALKEKSRASPQLRLYVLQQDRNLKKLRIKSPQDSEEDSEMCIDLSQIQPHGNIQIPDVKELFRDQKLRRVIHQNRQIRRRMGNNIQSVENTLRSIGAVQKKSIVLPVIEDSVGKRLMAGRQLMNSLEKQKQNMRSSSTQEQPLRQDSREQGSRQKPKKKIALNCLKAITVREKAHDIEMMPPTYLLHQLHNIAETKQRKERELSSLIKNSYHNRRDILNDKIHFYSKETQYYDLSPSSQMHLRNIMNRKLARRLDLSKRQVELFTDFIQETRESHTIISDDMIQLLSEIRNGLVAGKTIRKKDFQELLRKHSLDAEDSTTRVIVSKLRNMMF